MYAIALDTLFLRTQWTALWKRLLMFFVIVPATGMSRPIGWNG